MAGRGVSGCPVRSEKRHLTHPHWQQTTTVNNCRLGGVEVFNVTVSRRILSMLPEVDPFDRACAQDLCESSSIARAQSDIV